MWRVNYRPVAASEPLRRYCARKGAIPHGTPKGFRDRSNAVSSVGTSDPGEETRFDHRVKPRMRGRTRGGVQDDPFEPRTPSHPIWYSPRTLMIFRHEYPKRLFHPVRTVTRSRLADGRRRAVNQWIHTGWRCRFTRRTVRSRAGHSATVSAHGRVPSVPSARPVGGYYEYREPAPDRETGRPCSGPTCSMTTAGISTLTPGSQGLVITFGLQVITR